MIASEGSRHLFILLTELVACPFGLLPVSGVDDLHFKHVSGHSYFFRLPTKHPVEHIPFYPQAL